MAGRLFGTAGVGNAAPPAVAGFKVQTAVYGLPIPIVYGQARVAGNLIHFTDPKATAQLSQGSRSKLVKIDQQVTGYLYQAAVAIALSEGPILGIAKVWRDKDASVAWSVYSAQGWSLFLGTAAQAAWSYLTSNHPSEAVPYQLTAYVANPLLELPNDILSNYTWEVQGLAQFGSFGIVDANPGAIITDALTNADHGVGFPSAQLGDLSPFTQYCTAAGLFLSPVVGAQAPLTDQLAALVDAANSAFVWSDGKLKVLPYADQAITGNGVTYTPNVTPLYDLTDGDYLAPEGEDPVVVVRKRPSECFNQLTVEYEDRAHDYNPNVQEFKDQASIDAYGLRLAPALRFPAIKDAATARYVAQLKGQREISVLNTYQFTLPMRYALLEPMDLVTLTDAGLGLNKTTVRIAEVVETEDGALQMTAEDFPAGIASASRYGAPAANGTAAANNVAPGATTAPAIFEGPGALASSALEIWLAASGGANWGGCDVHLSTDNVTYQKVGSITRKANYGVLTTALPSAPASPPNDTTNTLAVDLTSSGGALAAGSASDLAALLTLCLVENEFLAYQGATLTAANKYNLTTLARGLFRSPIPASHAIGASFLRCDGALLKIPFPQGTNGQVLYFKFPAFNVYGLALEDVATVTAYAHTIGLNTVTTSAPTPPVAILSVDAADSDETTTTVSVGVTSGTTATAGLTYTLTSKLGSSAPVTLLSGAATALPLTLAVPRDSRRATVLKLSIVDPLFVAPIVRTLTVSASGRDGARGGGSAIVQGAVDIHRGGSGGLPIRGRRIPADGLYSDDGSTPLIDPVTRRMQTALALPNGTASDIAERGANKGDAALDAGNVLVAGSADFSRSYTGKHMGNLPDDATSDRRAATANEKTGGGRGFSAIDAGGVAVAGAVDLSRSYTGKHLGNMPDDATTDRRAATATEKTGGGRGAVALDAANKLVTGVTGAATAADGVAGIESGKGAQLKAARNAGHATSRDTDDLARGRSGGMAVPGARYHAEPVYNSAGSQVLLDPTLKRVYNSALDATVSMDNPSGVLGSSMQQTSSGTARAIAKGYQSGYVKDAVAVSFSPVFQNSPAMRFTARQTFNSVLGTAANQFQDLAAVGLTGSGFTMRALMITKGTITARTAEFTASLTTQVAGGTVGPATTANAPSNDGNYKARYQATVVCTTPPEAPSGSVTIVVAIEVAADGVNYTEYATRSHTVSRTTNGTTTTVYSAQEVTVNVAALTTTSKIRLKLKSITTTGGADVSGAPTLEGYDFNPTGEGHGVTYNSATGGSSQILTADADEYVFWEAWEVVS